MTDIKSQLMTDMGMFQFIEKGIHGGISYIADRYSKANNKYTKNYNAEEPWEYITYINANNLYGWVMSQYLPTDDFKWLTENEIKNTN